MSSYDLCFGCLEPRNDGDTCTQCGYSYAAQPRAGMMLPPGTLLHNAQYMVGRKLGQGGFGITYLGWDSALARKVAIKEYMPSQIAGRTHMSSEICVYEDRNSEDFEYGMQRFLDEAQTVAKFQAFPNIIWVYNFFRENSTAYMVMEYLAGETFEAYIAHNSQKVPFANSQRIMLPVMDALREVHKRNLLHRDISPDNIFIVPAGPVKVLDFGAARFELSQRSRGFSTILKQGYAPVEQYSSRGNQGPWTDVYAVACTMYRSLTGIVPTPSIDRREHDTLEPPSKLGVEIPPAAEAALMHALAVEIKDRTQSMQQFQAELLGQQGAVLKPTLEKLPPVKKMEPVVVANLDKKQAAPISVKPKEGPSWQTKLATFFKSPLGIGASGVGLVALLALVIILAVHGKGVPEPRISTFAGSMSDPLSGTTQLSWDVENAKSVSIDGGIGPVSPKGETNVRPSQTVVYTLTAIGQNDHTVSQTITVQGKPAAPPPNSELPGSITLATSLKIVSFDITPRRVTQGEVASLSWNVEGAQNIAITPDIGSAAPQGQKTVSFDAPGVHTWTLVASDPAGHSLEKKISLRVLGNVAQNVQPPMPQAPPPYTPPSQQNAQQPPQYLPPSQTNPRHDAQNSPAFQIQVKHDHSKAKSVMGFLGDANGTAGYCYGVLRLSNGILTYKVTGSTDQRRDPLDVPVKNLTSISVGKILGSNQTIHIVWNGQKYNFIPMGGGISAEQAVQELQDAQEAP